MKKSRAESLSILLSQIDEILNDTVKIKNKYQKELSNIHSNYTQSAKNLLHYIAVRNHDLRAMQKKLRNLGLSRFANLDSHVLSSLLMNKAILNAIKKNKPIRIKRADFSPKKADSYQKRNSKDLLGYRSKGRRTRIMVTLPTECSTNYELCYEMIKSGMNCCRINCAHDDRKTWIKMVHNIRKASKALRNNCLITMDLCGPKIRTGEIIQGPKILKIRTQKDNRGNVKSPSRVWISPEPHFESAVYHIPVDSSVLNQLSKHEVFHFIDTRRKTRKWIVEKNSKKGIIASAFQTSYVETGTKVYSGKKRKHCLFKVGQLPATENFLFLKKGEYLNLHQKLIAGENKKCDKKGNVLQNAHISCTSELVFQKAKPGDKILFDDGQITSKVQKVQKGNILLKITKTKIGGNKLRADKGINLPSAELNQIGMSKKDKADLKVAVEHADVVNLSFVNKAQDVRNLINELETLNAINKLGIIIKIETQQGFNNLIKILLEAMRIYPVGIMIARGDLAIEAGWNNIARVQEEILSICHSAHVPDIWATQVLENLAKKGLPSRAEISDTVMAQRAECIMLNKGAYIIQAIQLLNTILKEMKPFYDKSLPLSPKIKKLKNNH